MIRFIRKIQRVLRHFAGRLVNWLDDELMVIDGSRHPWIRQIFTPLVYQFRRVVLFLNKGILFRIYRMEGSPEKSEHRFRILFVTESRAPEYLQTQFFPEGLVDRTYLGTCYFWQVPVICTNAQADYDLVLVERNNLITWKPRTGMWLVVPAWVRMAFSFESGEKWEDRLQILRSQERNIRKIKKTGMTYRISHNQNDFDHFYERMYIPSVEERHGAYGIINKREKLQKYFNRGMLMFARTSDGEDIGGKLAFVSGEEYFGISNGILDGRAEWREAGAISAMYYYSILWCFENGIRRYDIGEVRPFEKDGIYLHKKRWGFQPIKDLWVIREWLFWVPGESIAAMNWFKEHPFLAGFTRGNLNISIAEGQSKDKPIRQDVSV